MRINGTRVKATHIVKILVDKSKWISGDYYNYSINTNKESLCIKQGDVYYCEVYRRINSNSYEIFHYRYTDSEIEILKTF